MIRAALLALVAVACTPAAAQELTAFPVEGQAHIAEIHVKNQITSSRYETTVLFFGDVEVHVHYETTPNYVAGQDPRDIVTVSVPDGYIAVPSELLIDEGATDVIRIYVALLG